MKALAIGISALTVLALLCTLICGFWIRAQATVDPSSLQFHRSIALFTGVCVLAALTLLLLYAFRQ